MLGSDITPFKTAKATYTHGQLEKLVIELDDAVTGLISRVQILEKELAAAKSKNTKLNLPTISGVDWELVKAKFPKMKIDHATCSKYHEQVLRLGFEPTLDQLALKQKKLKRTEGTHWTQLSATFGCTKPEALGWIWFLRKCGMAKEWVEQGTYCRTDLEYVFNNISAK